MADLLASIFGGGSVQAPVMPTLDVSQVGTQFANQDFSKIQGISDALTKNTSAANVGAYTSNLNTVDPGALQGLSAEQTLGNNLLSGSTSSLPSWAQAYLNKGTQQGAENAVGRGVGAFSANARSGVNQFQGNNALSLINLGSNLTNTAFGQANSIANATTFMNNPNQDMLTPGQFLQADQFNTQIQGQNAVNATAAANYNANNSPLGSAIRTGLSDLVYLAGSFLGGSGMSKAMGA